MFTSRAIWCASVICFGRIRCQRHGHRCRARCTKHVIGGPIIVHPADLAGMAVTPRQSRSQLNSFANQRMDSVRMPFDAAAPSLRTKEVVSPLMLNWLNCYLSGRHDYSVTCASGSIFLRCIHCGKRSNGWAVHQQHAIVAVAASAPRRRLSFTPSRPRLLSRHYRRPA
jgi:hypothetical protein